ncbi:MAG: LacI family DNA-binding transcriptional regulator [Muribaculaceae bacterium]|nr:LacI family DNA-binding transcriptional regulator [Roseburia sp.]MCM1430678.1 LacI family DNA-binding transcriptional regulator [Muribaculaceae bacterium]MCM1491945.1 LacI family DNA-binding transcriptional regulator [Muribaculaceae bacterium]
MNKTSKAPTMKDVAREAGVALGTVSKVFNGLPVGEKYKISVEQAAERLGYQVNQYARTLRTNKTNTIALILPVINNPFYASLADNCCEILRQRGYRMLIATTFYDPQTEQQCMDMVQQNKVDGIIAITYNPSLEIREDVPFIIIDRKFESNVPCVSSDNFSGGMLAAQKLVENGCKKLLFLGDSSSVPGEADKRVMGFETYCRQNHVTYDIVRTFDDELFSSIYEYIAQHAGDGVFPFDGIFCNTDVLACCVRDALASRGILAPADVQIIGYDGIQKFGTDEFYCSTIRQPIHEMAEMAISLLLSSDRGSLPPLVCLPVTYCYGGTTKS